MTFWTSIKNITSQTASQTANLIKSSSDAVVKWIQGNPAELTYWIKGDEKKVRIREFKEISDKCIQFKNVDTNLHVRVKAEYPITYIIREED